MFNSASSQAECMQAVPADGEERILINVGGVRHETYRCTLMSMPGTRLANLASGAVPYKDTGGYFFDRNADAFSLILNYYRTGKLHYPTGVCGPLFEEELAYWGISETDVEPCCWTNFRRHREAEEALAQLEPDYNAVVDGQEGQNACRSKVWALFDDPYSSAPAMIIAVVSLLFILVSISSFCVSTMPQFQSFTDYENYTLEEMEGNDTFEEPFYQNTHHVRFFIVEIICVIWFTFEFLVRIICCPDKRKFVQNILNIIDFLAILPFYLDLLLGLWHILASLGFLARCLRILRIFKMTWHLAGTRALVHTLRTSAGQMFLLAVPLTVAILILSTLMYFAEMLEDSAFHNIPSTFWWAVVTMTTVGYGDMYPVTWPGKVIGSLCALMGLLSIAMPIPILVYNFAKYYALTEAKHRRPVKVQVGRPR